MSLPPESLPPYYMQGNAINNRVVSTARPWLVLVTQADPNFERDKHHEIEDEFLGAPVFRRSQQARRVWIVGWAKAEARSADDVPTQTSQQQMFFVGGHVRAARFRERSRP